MASRTEEVRRDIEQARGELGDTLEAIGDRVAPQKVKARVKDDVSEKVEDVRDKMSPGRIVRRRTQSLRGGLRRIVGASDDGGRGAGGDGAGTLGTARQQAEQARGKAGDVAGRVALGARSAPGTVRDQAEGNPLAAGLFAFAAGFFAASRLPPTDRERQLAEAAKDRLEPFKDEIVGVGKEVAGELQQSAQQRLEQVKQTATGAVEQVKGEAQGTVQQLKDQTTGAAQEVKGQAKGAAKEVKGRAQQSTSRVKGETRQATSTVKGAAKGAASTAKGAAKGAGSPTKSSGPRSGPTKAAPAKASGRTAKPGGAAAKARRPTAKSGSGQGAGPRGEVR